MLFNLYKLTWYVCTLKYVYVPYVSTGGGQGGRPPPLKSPKKGTLPPPKKPPIAIKISEGPPPGLFGSPTYDNQFKSQLKGS